jgi:hypothetical protein
MEQHIFKVSVDYRGRHQKGMAIYDAAEVSLKLKLMFL